MELLLRAQVHFLSDRLIVKKLFSFKEGCFSWIQDNTKNQVDAIVVMQQGMEKKLRDIDTPWRGHKLAINIKQASVILADIYMTVILKRSSKCGKSHEE